MNIDWLQILLSFAKQNWIPCIPWPFLPVLDTVCIWPQVLRWSNKKEKKYILTIKAFLVMCGDGRMADWTAATLVPEAPKVTLVCQRLQAGTVDGPKIQPLATTGPFYNREPVFPPFVHCSRVGCSTNGWARHVCLLGCVCVCVCEWVCEAALHGRRTGSLPTTVWSLVLVMNTALMQRGGRQVLWGRSRDRVQDGEVLEAHRGHDRGLGMHGNGRMDWLHQ